MKVLVIGSRIPFPLHDGGAIATYNMLKGLARNGAEVTYISLNTSKHFIDEPTIKRELGFLKSVKTFVINTDIKALDAFKNLFTSSSYNIERFHDPGFESLLVNDILANVYDIIHFEGLFVAGYIDKVKAACKTPTILRQHNVEFRIWERLAENESNPFKKWYLGFLAKRIKSFEKEISKRFDKVVSIAHTDEDLIKGWEGIKSVATIPGGLEIPEITGNTFVENSIYHIGSMEWLPNRQAMEWFYRQVWPGVLKAVPSAQFYMAGKNMPLKYMDWESGNFHINGEVANAAHFAADKQILIVPLLSASGIRIKTIEAMMMGKAVVTTSVGAMGLPIENDKHCMKGDNAVDFANAIIRLLQDSEKRKEIANNGKEIATTGYDINAVARQWISLYRSMAFT